MMEPEPVDLGSVSLLMYEYGLFSALAETLARTFKDVFYFVPWKSDFPTKTAMQIGSGLPGVTRVHEFWEYVDGKVDGSGNVLRPPADLIAFPDIYDGDLQIHLENLGKRVWGSRNGDMLERQRVAAKEKMEDLGLAVGAYDVVEGCDALRDYLRHHPKVWVKCSETRGTFETFYAKNYRTVETKIDQIEYELGPDKADEEFVCEKPIEDAVEFALDTMCIDGEFPGFSSMGVEAKNEAYIGHFTAEAKWPPHIRDINAKIGPLLAEFGFRNSFAMEHRYTRDGKAYMLDPCFSEDTEILTEHGWRFFPDLQRGEAVCTLNTTTKAIEYQKPTDYIASQFVGDMVSITNKRGTIECLVTPNHMVWRTDRHGNGLFAERADSLTDKGYIPRTGKWEGCRQDFFTLPPYYHSWLSGRYRAIRKEKDCPAQDIPMDVWLRFLGLYLSEGSIRCPWAVTIAQHKHQDRMWEMLKDLPFTVTRDKAGLIVSSVQLVNHLRGSGLCNEKRVPRYVMDLPPDQIDVFLDAYLLGDGGLHKGQRSYFTTSEGMADDLQELVLLAGRVASVKKLSTAGTQMSVGGKEYTRRYDIYWITERSSQDRFWFETAGDRGTQYISRVPYDGMVYDVTVPNHTVYVRRNGKPFWSSNCCRYGAPPNELLQEMYTNLAEIMWYGAEGICIDPVPAGKWGVEIILHSETAKDAWLPVHFPQEYRRNVKLRKSRRKGGVDYVRGVTEIGAVVAVGDSLDDCIEEATEISKQVEAWDISTGAHCLSKIKDDMKRMKEYGISL